MVIKLENYKYKYNNSYYILCFKCDISIRHGLRLIVTPSP